ncbi:MAG: purine-nucleoside phosphorylase [bacterium]
MSPSLYDRLQEAKDFLKNRLLYQPQIAVVFGSGLADAFLAKMEQRQTIRFEEIPHFKKSTVPGHGGALHCGVVRDYPVLVSEGRIHYYEGYTMREVVFPVRTYASLGLESILLTNAAGGLNPLYKAGDFMVVKDHINLTGRNPLRGPNDERLGPRFPDMTEAYAPSLIKKLTEAAKRAKIAVKKGVYVGIMGPAYETPAEIAMYRKLGGDAIGMSTVPEVIAARHMGLKVAVISCITNALTSKNLSPLSHESVVEEAKKNQDRLACLLEEYLCDPR